MFLEHLVQRQWRDTAAGFPISLPVNTRHLAEAQQSSYWIQLVRRTFLELVPQLVRQTFLELVLNPCLRSFPKFSLNCL